ncbi:unnamed protein product [Boreogadus saida]
MKRVEENTMETQRVEENRHHQASTSEGGGEQPPPGLHLSGWRRTDTTRPPPQRVEENSHHQASTSEGGGEQTPPGLHLRGWRRTDTTRPPPQRVEENRHHQASTSEENRHHQASTSEGGGEQTPPGLTPPQREVLGRSELSSAERPAGLLEDRHSPTSLHSDPPAPLQPDPPHSTITESGQVPVWVPGRRDKASHAPPLQLPASALRRPALHALNK